jgi:hypothetical protein
MPTDDVSRAIAYFQACPDAELLRGVLKTIQPKAAAAVRQAQLKRRDIPPPLDIEPSANAATQGDALKTVRSVQDFAQLQALARAVGRRIEELNQSAPPV